MFSFLFQVRLQYPFKYRILLISSEMSTFSPILEGSTSQESSIITYENSGLSASATAANDTDIKIDLEFDDIFSELAKESKAISNKSHNNNASNNGSNLDKLQRIKKEIDELPNISDKLLTKSKSKSNKNSEINRELASEIKKTNDSIEDVISSTGDVKTKDKDVKVDRTKLKEEKTSKWFSIPKVELTSDLKRDLSILKNRSTLDPKRFYKKDNWQIPENFQFGTIVEDKSEFFSARLNKKQRSTTFTGELLKDSDKKQWFKRRYNEIQEKKKSGGKASYKKLQEKRRKF